MDVFLSRSSPITRNSCRHLCGSEISSGFIEPTSVHTRITRHSRSILRLALRGWSSQDSLIVSRQSVVLQSLGSKRTRSRTSTRRSQSCAKMPKTRKFRSQMPSTESNHSKHRAKSTVFRQQTSILWTHTANGWQNTSRTNSIMKRRCSWISVRWKSSSWMRPQHCRRG